VSLGIAGDGARSDGRVPIIEHMTCPVCEYPLTWSIDHERLWCAVHGGHGDQLDPTRAAPKPTPSPLLMACVAELADQQRSLIGGKRRHLKAVS
jgi:hypothetical protein